ncbi:sulfatase-like hydrolase/transferase [Psychrobacter sp. AOP7-D1-21]|uniref:sulfatase-like hydrolase/transferase n=1 Tax=Psychrobacter sp. AOP7-D1-21 TaxID=3457636 RepID=UPI003FB7790C
MFFTTHYSEDYHKISGNDELLISNKYDSVSKSIFNNIQTNTNGDKVLLIVNESLGEASDPNIQAALLAPLYKYQLYYEYIDDGSFSFVGPTVSGELRELCQKNATVMDISRVEDKEFANCLPTLLREQGYDTYSVHGTAGSLYDRTRWYPLIGFNHVLFKKDFAAARNCKSFSGKCDYDLFEPIVNILASKKKVFLYWLTLNTHTPYDDYLFTDGFDCEKYSLRAKGEACLNFKQQYQFFYRLSEYVQDDRMKGVEVYVVGDHAPPIMSLKDNFSVYEDFDVSWIKFKIK